MKKIVGQSIYKTCNGPVFLAWEGQEGLERPKVAPFCPQGYEYLAGKLGEEEASSDNHVSEFLISRKAKRQWVEVLSLMNRVVAAGGPKPWDGTKEEGPSHPSDILGYRYFGIRIMYEGVGAYQYKGVHKLSRAEAEEEWERDTKPFFNVKLQEGGSRIKASGGHDWLVIID